MPPTTSTSLGRLKLAAAILLPFSAAGLQLLIWDEIKPFAWMLFYPAIFCSSWLGGRLGGIVATIFSVALVKWFFMAPLHTFLLENSMQLWSYVVFGTIGFLVGQLHHHSRMSSVNVATAQGLTEQALALMARSETRYRTMVQEAPLGIALIDSLTRRFCEVNERFMEITGRSSRELLAMEWVEITHPDDIPKSLDNLARLNAGEISKYHMDKRYLHPDGSVIWVSMTIATLTNEEGDGPRHLCMLEEITRRVRREQLLRETTERLTLATDAANVGIWNWDFSDDKLQWDERIRGWYDLPRELATDGISPDYWRSRLHPDDLAQVEESLSKVRSGCALRWSCRFRIVMTDGSIRHIYSSSVIDRDERGAALGMIGINRDITRRKQYECELEQARETAEAANSSKSEFLANMSHEIRTPMNAVLGLAQLLENEPLTPEQLEMVQRIRASGRSLLVILNDLLDFSKIEAGRLRMEMRPFALPMLLSRLDNLLGGAIVNKGLALCIELPAEIKGNLIGDDLRLEQVLLNLVGNAIKFTEMGEIRLRVLPLELTDSRALLLFQVSDTGVGIAPEALSSLFIPFTQADGSITRRFGGTGLGLSISKCLVELMGGAIGVESREGGGSTFWFKIPFQRTSAADVNSAASSRSKLPLGPRLAGWRILVVDDSEINLLVVNRALAREGAKTMSACDGKQAVECLRAEPGGFEAVLMDVQMPVMDGLAATRAIRNELGLSELPVIAFTAGVLQGERQEALNAGVTDFLAKPVELEEMVALLLRWSAPRTV